jgi:type I restriction enzyme S subunit
MELGEEKYKKTDIGIIPSDWSIDYIKNLSIIKTGSRNTQDRIENGLYPFFVRSQTIERINSYSFDGEAVLTAGDGVGVGKVIHYVNEKFDCHQRVYRISDFSEKINGYYFYLYFSNNFLNRIMQMTAKSSVDSVRMDMIANMQIPLPPTQAEQTAIATALSDADALISSLEKLIVKKRNIKQGAIQKLLQPKEGWEVKKLGEIAEIRDGTHQTPKYVEAGIPFYSVESVTNDNFTNTKFISEEEHRLLTKTFKIEKGDILMTRIGSIGDCKLIDWDVNASFYVSLALLKIKVGFSANYICHYSKTDEFKKEADINSLQSAIPRKINLGPISNIKIVLPNNNEQTRIATILTDMDAEIKALETKLEKYTNVKLGMMQNLLTGKIRLI